MSKSKARAKLEKQLALGMALINGANTFAPMALLYARPDQVLGKQQALPDSQQPVAARVSASADRKPYSATNLQSLAYAAMSGLDAAVFGKAEATTISIGPGQTSTVDTLGDGEIMSISGASGASNSAVGSVGTINNGGAQYVYEYGVGSVSTMNDGRQTIYAGGQGFVNNLNGGLQDISTGGYGSADTVLTGGQQNIAAGGVGLISTMNGGTSFVNGSSTTSGVGTIVKMLSGLQGAARNGAVASITDMEGGNQVALGGAAIITNMTGGTQTAALGGAAIITNMTGGTQTAALGGAATITNMTGGTQIVSTGGTGSVATMSGGIQLVSSGTGSVDVMAGGTQLVYSGGTGTITTMNGGVQQAGEVDLYGTQFAGGVVSITTMNDGAQILSSGGTGTIGTMNSGSQDINSGAVGTVTNLMGGTQNVFEGGLAQATTLNNSGFQNVASGGSAVGTTINSGTQLLQEGSYSDNTTLNEEGTIQLDVNTSSTVSVSISTINANGGNIVLGTGSDSSNASKVGNVLNIAQLNGSANFTVNTDIASGNSDKINIASATNSTQNTLDINYDPIYDASGKNAAQNTNIKVVSAPADVKFFAVTTEQGGISFTPGLTQNADGSWSITGISAVKGASQNTLTAAASYQVINEAWFDTVNSLSKRLGDLRQSQACVAAAHTGKAYLPSGAKPAAHTDDGIWARYQRSTTRAGRGNKAELNANLMQVGYDKAFARRDGTAYVGIAVDHLNGGSEYQTGSGSASGTSVALYNTWLGNKGHYYDVILRQGHFGEDYHLTDMAGTYSSADYGVNATTLSGEYGYRKNYAGGRYLEPQAEIIYGHLSSADYHTSLGWPVHVDGVNHLITRVGVALGQSTSRGSYYFKTSYYHDFGGAAGSVTFGDYNYSRSALRDWAELTLGGEVRLAKNTQVYGELTKYLGDLTNNLNVNVGVRFSF